MLIFEIFKSVPDPRKAHHAFTHRLIDVLCIALCAMLSGAEGFVNFEDYGLAKESWLRGRLGLELPHGIPSHDTFNRVFSGIRPINGDNRLSTNDPRKFKMKAVAIRFWSLISLLLAPFSPA